MATVKKKAKKVPQGRPSSYTDKTADTICARIADGESLASICKGESMPHRATVLRWLAEDVPKGRKAEEPGFRDLYARAREAQADLLAEDIIAIADEEVTMVKRSKHQYGASKEDDTEDNEVEVVFDPTAVARNRLRVDARKWYAAKVAPKKYGEKVAIGGADDLPPLRTASELTDAQLMAIAAGAAHA